MRGANSGSTARWLFALLLSIYLVTGGGHGYSVDGAFGYEMSKTLFLDPQHDYFHRFKTAFARWGALLPLLGQPFVLAGNALSYAAPERDALDVAGHEFRVEEWPAIGSAPGAQETYDAPLPAGPSTPATSLTLISYLANSRDVPQGAVVATVHLWDGAQMVELPVRAGIDTSEWAYDRPDVRGSVQHARAPVAGRWIGQPRGNLYVAHLMLPRPMSITRWQLASAGFTPAGAGGPDAQPAWSVRAAAFRDASDGWHDVYTGERYWSARQTRDFFTRLVYSTVNAVTTAASGVLLFLIGRQFGYAVPVALVSALGFGLATMAWPYAKLDFSEPAATLFVLLALWALYRAFPPHPSRVQGSRFKVQSGETGGLKRRRAGAGPLPGDRSAAYKTLPYATHAIATGRPETVSVFRLGLTASLALLLAVIGKYTAALAAGMVVAQWVASSRPWRRCNWEAAWSFGAALILPAALLGVAATLVAFRFTGERPVVLSPRTAMTRLGEDWLALPFWTGFRGLLFSPGKSLFLYSPWLLLAVPGLIAFARRHRWRGLIVVAFPVLMVLLYSKKLVWHGGSWGPRYMLPIVPFLCLAALPVVEWALARGRAARLGLATLFAVSIAIQLVAAGKDPEQYPSMVREAVVPALPNYGADLGGKDYWLARGGPGLARALQDPAPGATGRGLGYLWGYPTAEMTLDVREAGSFDLSLYFVDWDRRARREVVTVEDALGRRTFDLNRDFGDGLWATWQVQAAPGRPVRIGLQQTGDDTAVLSAVAFDPARVDRRDQPVFDEQTKGTWQGTFGADGYVLFAWRSFNVDVASLPPYVAGYDVAHVGDKPDPRIHVEIADQDLRDTPLLYAVPFSPLLGNVWLLAADAAHLLLPALPGVQAGLLARPPWTWFGVGAAVPAHAEYGLGLDFWPTLLYVNYASHRGVLAAMWLALLGAEAVGIVAAFRLARAWVPRRALWGGLAALCVLAAAFDWLQVLA